MRVSYSPASSFNSLVDFIDGRPLQKLTPPSEAETKKFFQCYTPSALNAFCFKLSLAEKYEYYPRDKARGLSVQQMNIKVSDLFSTNFSGDLLLRILVIRLGEIITGNLLIPFIDGFFTRGGLLENC